MQAGLGWGLWRKPEMQDDDVGLRPGSGFVAEQPGNGGRSLDGVMPSAACNGDLSLFQ